MGDLVKQILARPIQTADQIIKAADEAASFKQECMELKSKTSKLSDLLRQAARSSADLYERPTRRIIDDTEQVLEKALSVAQKCRANGLLKRAFTIIPAAAFRKMFAQLENSIGDVSWLLRVSGGAGEDDGGVGGYLGLPPIAANEPILCLIWEQISILTIGSGDDRTDAAASLVSLARDNDRYGKLIIEEGGVGPLLKLLKEGKTVEGQENAARALGLLGRDPESVEQMVLAGVCSVFTKILKEGPMKVQVMVAWALSELSRHYSKCQDIFAQHHAVRLLVGHLAFETIQEHSKYVIATSKSTSGGAASIHNAAVAIAAASTNTNVNVINGGKGSEEEDKAAKIPHPMAAKGETPSRLLSVVTSAQAQAKSKINPTAVMAAIAQSNQSNGHGSHNNSHSNSNSNHHQTSFGGSKIREREMEDPETKANMKSMAARALCNLAKGNSSICRSICESRALLCFAVLLEKGTPEIQLNSAMAVMEITAVAERDADLRRSAFKPSSPACKAVVDQLLKVIEKANSELLIPCISAIGNLARTFRATETRMIAPLVQLLDEREPEVEREAVIALTKFAGSENYLRVDHSKAILTEGGIKHLIQLVYFGDQQIVKVPALELLSFIALHVPDSEELARNEVLTVLDWASKQSHMVQNEARETLLLEAKSRLELYQTRGTR
ncbi:Vacuolar protein 8 [Bienertia sinuspersici]